MEQRRILITGGTGFIGRSTLSALAARGRALRALVRSESKNLPQGVEPAYGTLSDAAALRSATRDIQRIIHLAASTGNRSAAEHAAINLEGTKNLLAAAAENGVSDIIYVSTIAAGYRDLRWYPYARSKADAEKAVAASALDFTILRPTIVLGPGGSAFTSFRKLASGSKLTCFGDGQVRIQPIHVEDVAAAITDLANEEHLDGLAHDLGGPEVLTILEFLKRIRNAAGLPETTARALPVHAIRRTLAVFEPIFRPLLPVTAGQLAVFVSDSTTRNDPWLEGRWPKMRRLKDILPELLAHG